MRALIAILTALMLFATTPVAADNTGNMEFNLGMKYAKGQGVPESDAKAVQLFTKTAKLGHPEAQFELGLIYARGKGVPKDNAKAVHWYTKAAKQGNASAQSNLAFMYTHGTGVPKDNVLAYAWINIAAPRIGTFNTRNSKLRRALERKYFLAKSMTRSQITEAQKLSLELWEKYVVPFQKKRPGPK